MLRKVVNVPVFGLMLLSALSAFSQADKGIRQEISLQPTSCEVRRIVLDEAFAAFQNLGDSSFLIIIARRGLNENRRSLALARMKDIEKFIHFRRVTDRYVLAEGPRTNNLGSAEIYVQGKLVGTIYFARNSGPRCDDN